MSDHVGGVTSPGGSRARGLLRWVCTNNPFYVISAGFFLAGLRVSFGQQANAIDTGALMAGLTGYTLLLAATAILLVRFARVWDDMRTVLLLVVLMFIATSVTFDEVLVMQPDQGLACYLGGLGFALVVSEVLLRAIQLRLPAGFRVPYYLILMLFFLYPAALSTRVADPHDEVLLWGLFGFPAAAGVIFLTLLPAVECGPTYVGDNGSPWRWPLYPWVLFGGLACCVPARSFLLCWSMHLLDGPDSAGGLVFGPYFLVPFGFALAVLLLQIGRRSGNAVVRNLALAAPMGLIGLTLIGHREAAIYQEFLSLFRERLGAGPLYLAVVVAGGFYLHALLWQVPRAVEMLTATLAALAFVEPASRAFGEAPVQMLPLLIAAALQALVGLHRRQSWRCLLGSLSAAVITTAMLPDALADPFSRKVIGAHLVLLTVFAVGAVFDDALGRLLRTTGALAVLGMMYVALVQSAAIEPWIMQAYPLAAACFVAAYGLQFRHRPSLAVAGLMLAGTMTRLSWWSYTWLRQVVMGLDYLALSLTVFVVAILISLSKSHVLRRRPTPETAEP